MAKYRAKKAFPPNIKVGDIVETDKELIPEYAPHFERVDGDSSEKEEIINPSRDELKAKATELGIDFAPNITTDKLMALVKEAEDKNEGDGGAGDGEDNEE